MQKLITVTIDVEKLQAGSNDHFSITEVEGINDLLDEGWHIEEWEFLTAEKEAEKAVLLVILNDDVDLQTAIYDMETDIDEEDNTENEDTDYEEEEESTEEKDVHV